MYIRIHKGQYVDAVIPTAVGVSPIAAPGDIVWKIPTDINPSKDVQELENMQATDEIGNPLFDQNGPIWAMENVLDANGNPIPEIDPETGAPKTDANGHPIYMQRIKTQLVTKTYALLENPNIFSPTDIENILINPPTVVS